MNKFMGGLTLGIIVTSCFFLFYHPFQKKAAISEATVAEQRMDTILSADGRIMQDALLPANRPFLQQQGKPGRDSLVSFARTLLGTPYLYGSIDPAKGFDCSGFITYVFNHFNMAVPRSSYDFADLGKKRTLLTCRPGDLILFAGTDTLEHAIGHIGIVSGITTGNPSFIHSSSGSANGVTVTSMDNKFYQERLIDVIDILY